MIICNRIHLRENSCECLLVNWREGTGRYASVSLNNNKVQGTHREVLDLFANTGAVNATIVSNFTCRHRKVTQLLRVAKAANLGDWRTYSWLELN